MPPSQLAIGQRDITSGQVTRFDEIWLAAGCHVLEADDGPRDHVADDDYDHGEEVFQQVAVSEQNALRFARLKLSQHPASRTATLFRVNPLTPNVATWVQL